MISFRLAQIKEHPEFANSPRVFIDPTYQTRIQKAVDVVNQHTPELLKGVTDIIGSISGGPFGQYKTKSPGTIYVNIPKIDSEVRSKLSGQSEDVIEKEIQDQLVKVITHESKHREEFAQTGHSSEVGPEAAEKATENFLSPTASMIKNAYIRKVNDEYCVFSHKDKKMGCYGSEKSAKKRLRQIEYWKRQ